VSDAITQIELCPELLAFAEERVRAGEYASVSDVAQAAFRLLKLRAERLEETRVELGGYFQDVDEAFLEPSDEGFADAVHEHALKHLAE
jgi:Arc/MetJ-type ribon-helix-helix transcriptional regulator